VFALILAGMLLGNVAVWLWMRRRTRHRRWLGGLLLAFQLPLAGILVWMVVSRDTAIRAHEWVPAPYLAVAYFWNLIVVPLTLIGIGVGALVRLALRARAPAPPVDPSRRGFLSAAVALVPPVMAGTGVAIALPRLNDFRVRRLRVELESLPPALDGMTIAHVTDVHYGKFTDEEAIRGVVETVNALEPDLVLATGDLIDLSIDDLDAGIAMLQGMRGRSGLYLCEGNHDLIDDGAAFRRRVRAASLPLLVDDAATVVVNGEAVQLLGVRWARGEAAIAEAVRGLISTRRLPGAFPILLCHHPHGFDSAAGIPLTLSGHTHGGLLMLNEKLGAGPVLYRYWSGLYRRDGRALVVSNGIGSWFPVRAHAPAEIVHLTLTRPAQKGT